ncbi:uncharacterized protein N7496_012733 [Penicillium cataractarum]|uniref:Major facilitator superfamily (MFS) profile domain-containing protein n=1 Tax=Penicillium cataractarum TaxID=2100454 RepID=A0A9W9R8F2_9EURO|nr:uncharacterized protein N7496_012733 [Penicillium cataractarum]KAJ5355521.1 hypothetical protein N7496_012733 [Penicillium cataractarum]
MARSQDQAPPWGHKWRSSEFFIIAATATALLTDMFLHQFLVSILPFVLENRLGLGPELIQRVSEMLLAETALVSFIVTPVIGRYTDHLGARTWLLLGLFGELGGSMIIASAHSLLTLFAGRFVQAVANTIVGVLGITHLTNNTSSKGTEKIYGVLTVSLAAGSCGGPLMAGAMFELTGYWTAWMSAFGASVVGLVLQSLMLVPPQDTENEVKSVIAQANVAEDITEASPLLVPSSVSDLSKMSDQLRSTVKTIQNLDLQFYIYLLTNRRYIGGILSSICYAIVSVSFDTTLPIHVGEVFQWGSLQTGILFAILQGPNAFFSVPVKWLKDRVGSRYPTSVGFLGLAGLLWLAGTPGDDRFPWANLGYRGPVIYGAAIAAMGIFMTLLNGTGMMEAANAVRDIETQQPGRFGEEAYSQAMLISRLSWTFGLFLGPIVSGQLTEKVGYHDMTGILATMCLFCAVFATWTLKSSPLH